MWEPNSINRGKLVTYKGCGVFIQSKDGKTLHNYEKNKSDDFITKKRYHCEVKCLIYMKEPWKEQLCSKRFPNSNEISTIQEELNTLSKKYKSMNIPRKVLVLTY